MTPDAATRPNGVMTDRPDIAPPDPPADPFDEPLDDPIAAAIVRLTRERGPDTSICPSEAAKAVAPEAWRGLMKDVRRTAVRLADAGRLVITRKGRPVDPHDFKGVYRLKQP